MATFRPSSVIEKQLEQARGILPAGFKEPAREDFGAYLQWKSIKSHIRDLENELEMAVAKEMEDSDFQFSLDGGPVRKHSVSAGFLADVLKRSQELIDSIAAFVIPDKNLRDENALMVDGSFQSSFGLKFHVGKGERTMEEEQTGAKISEVLCRLMDGDAEKSDLAPLLKHPELRTNYFALVRVISKAGARIVVRTRTHRSGTRLNSFQANQRLEWVDATEQTEENLYVSGILNGGGIRSGRFEIEAGNDFYTGRVSSDAKEQMKAVRFGQKVDAWILESREFKDGNKAAPKISFLLKGIDPADD